MNRNLEIFFLSKTQTNRFILGAQICALMTILLGAISLLGWLFDLPLLRSLSPQWVEMTRSQSVGFVIAGVSLFLLIKSQTRTFLKTVGFLGAAVLVILGSTTVIEFIFYRSAHGRMGLTSAINFILCGFSLFFINYELKNDNRPSQYLAMFLALAPLQALIVYAHGVKDVAYYKDYYFATQMPIHGAFSWLLLSFGILMAKPDRGLLRPFTLDKEFSQTWRYTLAMAMLVPTLFGILFSAAAQRKLFEPAFGYSLLSISCIMIMTIFIWRSALNTWYNRLKKIEGEKETARALKLRDEFLSIASHELKTPLTSLTLQAQIYKYNLLRKEIHMISREELLEYFDRVDSQVGRLAQLVEDMLDISRIDSGSFIPCLEKTDLVTILQSALMTLNPQLISAGCEIRLEAPGMLIGFWDRFRIEQVIINLITNAMKYGANKPIIIRLYQENNVAKISVKDHGIGIAKENQQRIFNRFERAVSAKGVTGLGLGLYIVKKVLDIHKGRIHVESEVDKGSTFTVELPLAPVSTQSDKQDVDQKISFKDKLYELAQ